MQKINEEFKYGNYYIGYSYKDGELNDISIQEKDGGVLFSGNESELRKLHDLAEIVLIQVDKNQA